MEKQNSSIFSFKIFLLKIAIIVIIIGFAFSLVFEKIIINKSQSTGSSKIDRILTLQDVEEIPILGSSRAEGNFVPSIIGKEVYNYGIAGTQANIWLYFLEQELKKNKIGPIIINFDLIGLISEDGNILNYIPHWHMAQDIIENEGKFYYNIPFIKYFGEYENYLVKYLQEKTGFSTIIDNGAVLQTNKLTMAKFKEMAIRREKTKEESSINSKLATKFDSLISSTKRTIILVVAPYHKSCFNENANFGRSNEYLNRLKKNNNIRIFDLRNFIQDDNLFLNTTHLNSEGAIKFSKKIKELLTTKAKINQPDRSA